MRRVLIALSVLMLGAGVAAAAPPAKKLFGKKRHAAALAPRAIGFYSRGCLAGGAMLPINGPAWQAMRLSRHRNWGHPNLVKLVQRLAVEAQKDDEWPGLMVGDMSQPRGGPMLTGHRSHQIGLDADIWLRPMPDRRLTWGEREETSAISMLKTKYGVNPKVWTPGHVKLLKRAASLRQVARIFVHPAIKKALCEAVDGQGAWLGKIRPWWGHHYHFHIRMRCPRGSPGCKDQKPPPGGTGCGKPLEEWFKIFRRADNRTKKKKPKKPKTKVVKKKKKKKRRQLRLADLPKACRTVLAAPPAKSAAAVASAAGSVDRTLPWLVGGRKTRAGPIPLPDRNPGR